MSFHKTQAQLRAKPGVVVPEGENNYGMDLETLDGPDPEAKEGEP